jgi:hypothetical protein
MFTFLSGGYQKLARFTAALTMKFEDLRARGAGWVLRLRRKAACIYRRSRRCGEQKGLAVPHAKGHRGTKLAEKPMDQADAWCMARRRTKAADIMAPIGNHSFRATGVTAYLANGGTLEHA